MGDLGRARGALELDARWKLGLALLALVVALGGPAPLTPALVASLALLVSLWLGRPLRQLALPVFVSALSGLLVTLMHLFLGERGGEPGPGEPHFAFELGLTLFTRMAAGAWVFGLFVFVTPPWKVVSALRALRMPSALGDVVALAVRYVTVLGTSARTAREAQLIRGGYSGYSRSVSSLGALSGLTLLRAFDQASATAEAMTARGCCGDLVPSPPAGRGKP